MKIATKEHVQGAVFPLVSLSLSLCFSQKYSTDQHLRLLFLSAGNELSNAPQKLNVSSCNTFLLKGIVRWTAHVTEHSSRVSAVLYLYC